MRLDSRFGPDDADFRCTKASIWLCAAVTGMFGLVTIGSVGAALLNLDGSFGHPILAAAMLGIGYGSIFALCSWLTAYCFRHRLRITPELVQSTGVIRIGEIRFAEVDRVVWKSMRRFTVVLHGVSNRLRISFGDYAANDTAEIIRLIRSGVAGRREEGWDRFEPRLAFFVGGQEMTPAQARRLLRFVVIACGASTAIATAALLWAKSVDEFSRMSWTATALLPVTVFAILLGFVWLMVRPALSRSDEPPKSA